MDPRPDEPFAVEAVEGERVLRAVVVRAGSDLVVTVTGGDRPHAGCAVVAVPRPSRRGPGWSVTVSVAAVPPHRDEAIARPIAEAVAGASGAVTVAVAGVHETGADARAIAAWVRLAERLARELALRLGSREPGNRRPPS